MAPTPFSEDLKRILDSTGISQTQLAASTGLSLSSLNRWVTGGGLPRRENAEVIDRVLAQEGRLLARFDESRDGVNLPPWTRDLTTVEPEARAVDVVATLHVPGYLQSPRYAETLFRAARPWDSRAEIDRLVQLRCQRLEQLPELQVTAVLPETALTTSTFPADVRAEQVATLLSWASSGRVTIHLVPAGASLLVPIAPVMVFRLRNGEAAVSCDYAGGSVLTETSEHPLLIAAVSRALASAHPASQSLAILEGLQ
ncbi:helix-turn-helix domain-containing protein [Nocardiopsis aegyptia]|uniref:helix-turn-helix domain-containing protein n=1 Tax=Nocardiopsis aegyptia TaxID=220378 RepID=UPI00366B3771